MCCRPIFLLRSLLGRRSNRVHTARTAVIFYFFCSPLPPGVLALILLNREKGSGYCSHPFPESIISIENCLLTNYSNRFPPSRMIHVRKQNRSCDSTEIRTQAWPSEYFETLRTYGVCLIIDGWMTPTRKCHPPIGDKTHSVCP